MKRTWMTMWMVAAAVVPALGQTTQPARWVTDAVDHCAGSMAMVSCTLEDEVMTPRTLSGPGFCIAMREGKFGVLLTTALNTTARPEMLKDFVLDTPGIKNRKLKAKLLGIDPETGLAFVEATEPYDWKVTRFAKVNLSPGDPIASIGLFTPKPDYHETCLGLASVSALLRVPEAMVYVTGGSLPGPGSLVFSADSGGKAIGLVINQPYVDFQMLTNQGTALVGLRNRQQSEFFTPVEEIAHILQPIPTPDAPRKLSWLGVLKFLSVNEQLATSMKLTRPGVLLDTVIPGDIGEKAGLVNRDVVVEVNGQPLEALPNPDMVAQNFLRDLRRMAPGTPLKLTVISAAGQTKTIDLKLAEMPPQPQDAKRLFLRNLGIFVREQVMLDKYLDPAPSVEIPGLIVVGVGRDSPAGTAGLKVRDVITRVNNQEVKTTSAMETLINNALKTQPLQTIILMVRRGNQDIPISVQPPRPS